MIFWVKFAQKRYFRTKTEKVNIVIKFCIFELVSEPNFCLSWQFLIFWTNFAQKVCFQSKEEKVNITIEFCLFDLVLEPSFSSQWQFWFFFLPNLPKIWPNLMSLVLLVAETIIKLIPRSSISVAVWLFIDFYKNISLNSSFYLSLLPICFRVKMIM